MPDKKPGLPDDLYNGLVEDFGAVELASRKALETLLKAGIKALSAQDSSILTPDTNETLRFFHSTNPKIMELDLPPVPIADSIAGFVYLTAQTMTFDQVAKAPKFYDEIDKTLGYATKEYLAAPIVDGEAVLGVLTFVNRTGDQGSFTKEEIRLADECAGACGIFLNYIASVRQNANATNDRLRAHLGIAGQPADAAAEEPPAGQMGGQGAQNARSEIMNALNHLQDQDVELIRDLIGRLHGRDDTGLVF